MKGTPLDRRTFMSTVLATPQIGPPGRSDAVLEAEFRRPPAAARPWVYWFWINSNISREGITADLESFREAGIGGVLWMEVSGPWWAPEGDVEPLSPRWHEAMQWAIRECRRLGLEFDLSVDFGYGSGGPHITPELSMQQLVWSEKEVEGGRPVDLVLEKAQVPRNVSAWLRPGAKLSRKVLKALEKSDSYRDVAVVALPVAGDFRIPELVNRSGLHWNAPRSGDWAATVPRDAVAPLERVVDLSSRMDRDGRLNWHAPPGQWLILRLGHASNLKMTRPCPAAAVGLECDRLAKAGIETHYEAFLKKLITGAGPAAGPTLSFVHIDSWEAGGQNWTATFPAEFKARRGYDLLPWLPVLTGRVVGSPELSERFLWDMRTTVGEMIRENYAGRMKSLARQHGVKLSIEAYGHLCIDNLAYAGVSDMPVSEFWARGGGKFPGPGGYERSSKAMASAAHVYGRPIIGAEAFTSDRAWQDHPFLLKAMGDRAFCRGINRLIFHLSAHQPGDRMIPGLTHRRWGEHFQRHNTWWGYSRVWNDYLARCQHLLQMGAPVADVCYLFGEGAPLNVDAMDLELPAGYDYDLCPVEVVLQAKVKNRNLILPSGLTYRYLLLPDAERMTLPLARKLRELVQAGARVIGGAQPHGAPGLTDYPQCDQELARITASLWNPGRDLATVFAADGLKPDFEGAGLQFIHRRIGGAEVYFVSHQESEAVDRVCTFRVNGMRPELWDPETGAVRALPEYEARDGRLSVPLHFEPMQSWFVVFRAGRPARAATAKRNFVAPVTRRQVDGSWQVTFDARWGGPPQPVRFGALADWSRHPDPAVHYYSGTATYRRTLTLSAAEIPGNSGSLLLDLGAVEVMARVRLNGKECGIAWKPPYRVDLSAAARAGENNLEIDVVNLWINRMVGDEQLPEDCAWKDFETLLEWPEWFKSGRPRPSGRFTFSSCKHYRKDSPLAPSGLLGPVLLQSLSP